MASAIQMSKLLKLNKINKSIFVSRSAVFTPVRSLLCLNKRATVKLPTNRGPVVPQPLQRRSQGTETSQTTTPIHRSLHRTAAMPQQQHHHHGEFQGQSVAELEAWLTSHNVNTALFGVGASKPLALLLEEISEGESTLSSTTSTNTAQRAVSVVNVLIKNEKNEILYEALQIMPPLGIERRRNIPLSEKMFPGEHWRDAARRGVQEELCSVLVENAEISIDNATYMKSEEKKESQSYPGLVTNVRRMHLQKIFTRRCCYQLLSAISFFHSRQYFLLSSSVCAVYMSSCGCSRSVFTDT